MKVSHYKQCQSCGMPLQTKKAGDCRGTEKDGTRSEKWCSLCYENGEFIGGDCTLDEMKIIVANAMENEGINWIIRKMAIWQLPHLERWNNK